MFAFAFVEHRLQDVGVFLQSFDSLPQGFKMGFCPWNAHIFSSPSALTNIWVRTRSRSIRAPYFILVLVPSTGPTDRLFFIALDLSKGNIGQIESRV
jgi:hypothetical protein